MLKRNFISTTGMSYFVYYINQKHITFCINILMKTFWRFTEYFRPLSEDLRRFSKIVPKARGTYPTFPKHFRTLLNISEDSRRLSKMTEEDRKMFRSHTSKFTCNSEGLKENVMKMISSHVRISYLLMWWYHIVFINLSCAVFWRARRASQNPTRQIWYVLANEFRGYLFTENAW